MTRLCPSSEKLSRAFSRGADVELSFHVASCPRCQERWRQLEQLRREARALPFVEPSEIRTEAVRANLLKSVQARTPRKTSPSTATMVSIGAACMLAATAVLFFVDRGRHGDRDQADVSRAGPSMVVQASKGPGEDASAERSTGGHRGKVETYNGASFVELGAQPDEIVRLRDGTITVEVQRLGEDERFRVITGDAEVEVRGTAFDVTARDDHLLTVRVLHGRVEVRPDVGPSVVLEAGERWKAPRGRSPSSTDSRGEGSSRAHVTKAARRGASRAAPARSAADPSGADAQEHGQEDLVEQAFAAGFEALREERPNAAAESFERALSTHMPSGLHEDAAFWLGVALARAERPAEAARALRTFIADFSGSPRRAEACNILAWLLMREGDLDGAEAYFLRALDGATAEVGRSARAGLTELEQRRSADETSR